MDDQYHWYSKISDIRATDAKFYQRYFKKALLHAILNQSKCSLSPLTWPGVQGPPLQWAHPES